MTKTQARLVLLISQLPHGGAQKQLAELAVRLKQRGWDVRVVLIAGFVTEQYQHILDKGAVEVISLGFPPRTFDLRIPFRLARVLRAQNITVLHSFLVFANLMARLSRLFYRVPVQISSVRNVYEGGRRREILYRLTDPLCDVTTQNSERGAQRYIDIGAVPAHKMRVIPNGIDVDRYKPDAATRQQVRIELDVDDRFVWLAVGRLAPAKNYPLLFRAFQMAMAHHPDAVLFVAGDGDLRADLETFIIEHDLVGRIRLLGKRDDIPALLNAADALVLASSWEGMANVLLEAGAAALPVVASDTGACREIVLDGDSGFIVPTNDLEMLAVRMKALTEKSISDRRAMGQRGREHIGAHFSFEQAVSQWEEIYCELLDGKSVT
jgi:glycosyltransferase involved in cell wall biosynthesis